MATVKTSQFKFCPLCSKPLSHTWNEGYCTHKNCLWNAPQCWEKEADKECTLQAGLVSGGTGSDRAAECLHCTVNDVPVPCHFYHCNDYRALCGLPRL